MCRQLILKMLKRKCPVLLDQYNYPRACLPPEGKPLSSVGSARGTGLSHGNSVVPRLNAGRLDSGSGFQATGEAKLNFQAEPFNAAFTGLSGAMLVSIIDNSLRSRETEHPKILMKAQ